MFNKMREAKFTILCTGKYPSSLLIPDQVKEGEELAYIRQNLDRCIREGEIKWLRDAEPMEAVKLEDIKSIEEVIEEVEE